MPGLSVAVQPPSVWQFVWIASAAHVTGFAVAIRSGVIYLATLGLAGAGAWWTCAGRI